MKVLLDTSVLVAALVHSHPDHNRSFALLRQAHEGRLQLVVSAHSLAETYAVLSTLPVKPRISPETARRLLRESVEPFCTVHAVDGDRYLRILDRLRDLGVTGGAVYDAITASVAETQRVDRLFTMNVGDFRRVWPAGGERIREP